MRRRGKHLIVDISAEDAGVSANGDPASGALASGASASIGSASSAPPGDLALLIHLMSAGRLQLYERRAGPRDRTSRLLVRVYTQGGEEHELRLREFGSKQAAWVKLLRSDELSGDEALAKLGPEAWPDPPDPPALAKLLDAPRPLHPLLRDQRVIAGIGRSWVDEILWDARLSPYKRGADLDAADVQRLREAILETLAARSPTTRPRSHCRSPTSCRCRCRSIAARASRARAAGRRSRRCTSRTTSSRTVRTARPRAGC